MPYDALKIPDPEAWLDLDEQERIDQVIDYHRRYHLPMGESVKLHGVAHVIVENQIAFGDSPAVPETLARLMGDGARPARRPARRGQCCHGHRVRRNSPKR